MQILKKLLLGVCLGLLLTASVAQAGVVHSEFLVQLNPDNTVTPGPPALNSGFDNGNWFEYTDPGGGPNWWNQWFFNSPDIPGSKWIEWDIFMEPLGDPIGVIEVAINYSTRDWIDPNSPPLPDLNQHIIRESIYVGIPSCSISNIGDPLLIPDFNPIWVSIDIRVLQPMPDPVSIGGSIWHEHHPIPEPSTFVLLGIGGVAIVGYGWHRKRRPVHAA